MPLWGDRCVNVTELAEILETDRKRLYTLMGKRIEPEPPTDRATTPLRCQCVVSPIRATPLTDLEDRPRPHFDEEPRRFRPMHTAQCLKCGR